MGNILSFFFSDENRKDDPLIGSEKIENFLFLEDYSKNEVIQYIQEMQTIKLNLENGDKLKDVELETTKLLLMCIELFNKAYDLCGQAPKKETPNKKMYFVKPKFEFSQIRTKLDSEGENKVERSSEFMHLYPVQKNLVSMKNCDIDLEEFNNAFTAILGKKDMLGISKLLLKVMPDYLKLRFINCFNYVLSNSELIREISLGKGSYVYKIAKKGPLNDINSFRPIISIPNIVNHFHRILTLRLNHYLAANKYINTDIQKGGMSGNSFSIFEQYFKVKNILKNANVNKKPVAVLFLDIANAYGSLDLESLYEIMGKYNIDPGFINYVREFYKGFQYYVNVGENSGVFDWKNGLVQGCSMSAILFVLAINYVLVYLDGNYRDDCGYDFEGKVKILFTAFIDDITIICKNMVHLEQIYNRLVTLFGMIGLKINKDKCAVMVVNDTSKVNGPLNEIQKVNFFKYLGEYVSVDGSSTESYAQFVRSLNQRLINIDKKVVSDAIKMEVFNKCVLPWAQRKTLAMYDIGKIRQNNIVAIVRPYLEKWNNSNPINIFSNATNVVSDSKDSFIIGMGIQGELDEDLEASIDLANYTMQNPSVTVKYNEIHNDLDIDRRIEELDTIDPEIDLFD